MSNLKDSPISANRAPLSSTEPHYNSIKWLESLDTAIACFSDAKKRKRSEPPVGMEKPFEELYSMLQRCLLDGGKTNVTAIVMGTRGCGKTFLVDHSIECLAAQYPGQFRIVRLNCLVARGDDVGSCVREIVRQLSDIARKEASTDDSKSLQRLLRLRQSSFSSNLTLLDEALRMASSDGIPTLVVLDEFDALVTASASAMDASLESTDNRQLLLYHLLDRVTTQGTSLSVVATTCHLAVVSMLEKRIRSRAEGTSKVVFINPCPSYSALVQVLLSKFEQTKQDDCMAKLKRMVCEVISPPSNDGSTADGKAQRVQEILERNYQTGKDMRWFCRVMYCVLCFYRDGFCESVRREQLEGELPSLSQHHFLHALVVMEASFANEKNVVKFGNVAVDARMQALLDLSGPQVALVLAAQRILARDAITDDTIPKPITLHRMLQEYQSYRGPHRYSDRILTRCFDQLLEMDVLKPSADHTGGGPLQYEYNQHFSAMHSVAKIRMPLHFPADIERELGEALKNDLLECSTALREWGKKKN